MVPPPLAADVSTDLNTSKRPDPISKRYPERWTKDDWEFVTERLEDAIAAFVPRMSHAEIRDLFEKKLKKAERSCQDWLSVT